MLDENELLFDELYEKTKDCGRIQFINLLMSKERENQQLKHIQDELEKYLEENIKRWEQEEQKWIEHGFMKFGGEANNKIIFKKIFNKLKELRGRENE